MRYETYTDEREGILFLKISGEVGYEAFVESLNATEEQLRYNFHLRLIIDGTDISHFDISNQVCQQMAPGLFNFARRAAFFSPTSLVFGMMRVMHACAFNSNFGVFRSLDQAKFFVTADRTSAHLLHEQEY